MTRLIGIDPGSKNLGWGVVDAAPDGKFTLVASGTITTKKSAGPGLIELADQLDEVLAAHSPTLGALERLFVTGNRRSAMAVGQARGVVLLLLARHGIDDPGDYTPQQVKLSVAGHGHADKERVAVAVGELLEVDTSSWTEHQADAVAVAVSHERRRHLPPAPKKKPVRRKSKSA